MKNMAKVKNILLCSGLVLLLAACQSEAPDLSMPSLATVNGVPITSAVLKSYLRQQGITEPSAEQNGEALENLLQLYVVSAAAADDAEFMQQTDLQAQLELARRRILFERYAADYVERFPVSDQQLRQQYQDTVKASGRQEYRLETLSFEQQADAMQALVRIQQGESSFAQLAAAGDSETLDWTNPAALPKAFRDALQQTAVGELVAVPLDSGRDWRLVRVADSREFSPPPFAQVSEGMRADINRKKVQAWIQGLRERAEIELENVSVDP
jgi:peptidyl-prolyl cis-trans isomerase C